MFEAVHPMRLKATGNLHALDRLQRNPDGFCRGAAVPMGQLTAQLGAGQDHHLDGDVGGAEPLTGGRVLSRWPSMPSLIVQMVAPDG